MKIISTFHKLLFFKTSHPYTLGTKIWKNILGSYESKKNICLCRQLKYYQLRVRNETGISLEIILNVSKCLTVSLFTEILILDIAPLPFVSVGILSEFDMLPDVYILLSPREDGVYSFSWGDRCTHLEVHSSKTLNP